MVDCKKAEELMPDYVMNLVKEDAKKDMEEHLKGCKTCRELYESMKKEGDAYDEAPEDKPFQKINKEIKKIRVKKILFFYITLILAILLLALVIGELNPRSGLPSITRLRYRSKARSIAQDFFDGKMETVLMGAANEDCGAMVFKNGKGYVGTEIIEDYILQLKKLYNDELVPHNFEILDTDVKYTRSDLYYIDLMDSLEADDTDNYVVKMLIGNGGNRFYIEVSFVDLNTYSVGLISAHRELGQEENEFDKAIEKADKYISFVEGFIFDGYYGKYVLYDRLCGEKQYIEIGDNFFTTNCMNSANEDYTAALNEKLPQIIEIGKTESADMVIHDYDKDKHTLNVMLVWKIEDANGKKAIMTKYFNQGPFGYQKADETEQIMSEEGFDPKLIQQMKDLF